MSLISRLYRPTVAILLSLTILALAPGLRCYDAFAATLRSGKTVDLHSGNAVLLPQDADHSIAGERDATVEPVSVDFSPVNVASPQGDVRVSDEPRIASFVASTLATVEGGRAADRTADRTEFKGLVAGVRELARAKTSGARRDLLRRIFERGRDGAADTDSSDVAAIRVSNAARSIDPLSRRDGEPVALAADAVPAPKLSSAAPWTIRASKLVPAAMAVGLGTLAGLYFVPDLFSHSLTATTVVAAGAVGMASSSRSSGTANTGYKRGKEKLDVKSFPVGRIFAVLKPYKKIMAWATFVMTIQSLVMLILPKLFSQMMDMLIGKAPVSPLYAWVSGHAAGIPGLAQLWSLFPADPWTASLAFILLSAVAVSTALFFLMKRVSWLMTYIGSVQMRDLSVKLYSHILHLPLNLFQKYRSGELTAVIDTNLYDLRLGATSLVTDSIKQLILLLLTLGFLFQIHWVVALSSFLVFAVLLGGPSEMFRSARNVVYSDFYDSKRKLTGESQEKFGNVRVAKAYGQEAREVAKYEAIAEDVFMDKGMRIAKVSALQFASEEVLVWLALFIVAAIGGYYVHVGQLTVGEFSSMILYAYFLKGAVGTLAKNYKSLGDTQGAAKLVFELWDRATEAYNNDRAKGARVKGDIQIKDLHFAYTQPTDGGKDELVDGSLIINGMNLHIPAGTSLAVVGKSGSGKTTLSDLIMRFLEPTPMANVTRADGAKSVLPLLSAQKLAKELEGKENIRIEPLPQGTISVDGGDIAAMNLVDYRNQFGLVPQEPAIFSGSVLSNIVYGKPDATMEQIEAAVKQAHAYDFIKDLDNKTKDFKKGLETVVGERGVRLSTGQKQRLMIARAFLVNPPILIMDEPTASLDAESEEAVVKAMENIMAGRTTIVVAHRLSTIQRAQKVIFLEKGRIAEEGSIEELLKIPGGKFRAYWETQSLKEQLEQREKQDKPGKKK